LKNLSVLISSLIATNNPDSTAISLLTSHLTAEARSSIYNVPPPTHLAILITMLVHPSTTNTPLRVQSAQLLSRVLDVASPAAAGFETIFDFSPKRKRSDDSHADLCELETESLFSKIRVFWDLVEWAFYKGEGGWEDILCLIVRILRIDFENAKKDLKYELKKMKGEYMEREMLTKGILSLVYG
jgi:hypothetical protein